MESKHKSKPAPEARRAIVQAKFKEFYAKHPDLGDKPPSATEIEACAVAIISALLWTQGDHNKPPFHYYQEATHLLRQVQQMLEQRDDSARPKPEQEITFTPREAATALGFRNLGGFWDAVRRYFGDQGIMKWKLRKRLTYAHLKALNDRRTEANKAKAAKGRAAKGRP